jgi:Lrp/AsnC family transcriptional regulator, leucine-responsive regulatory protein
VPDDIDATDWAIIAELQRDARLSFNQLAKLVNLSAPSVATRVRRLEDANVIEGYHARIDPAAAGLPLMAFLQLHCHNGWCLLKTATADQFPEIVEIHRLSGRSCSMVKVRTASIAHLSSLLERVGEHAETDTHVVLETQYEHRPVEAAPPVPPAAQHPGWSRKP